MPAKSKKQQRFFALVRLYQEGKIKRPSESIRRAAESISAEDARHFAATSHEGLPEKAAEYISRHIQKRAWTKTPVVIQNKDTVYEFESIEEACQYLASIGTLSYDDVNEMLSNREVLINGFRVTYPEEKMAQLEVIDPHRKQNAMLRARKILDKIHAPKDSPEDEESLEEERKKNKEHLEKLKEDVEGVLSIDGNTIKAVANLLGEI